MGGAKQDCAAMSTWNSGSEFQFQVSLAARLLRIHTSISEHQFHSLKLVCLLLDISKGKLDNAQSLTDLYQLIQQKVPQYAPSLIYHLLYRVGVAETSLQGVKEFAVEPIRVEDNQIMDLLLTLSLILEDIDERSYRKFMEWARLEFLKEYRPSHIATHVTSRAYLLELLLYKDIISPRYLAYFIAWLRATNCSFQAQHLRQYCVRQGIDEPDCTDVIVPSLGDEFEADEATFLSFLERDGTHFDKFIIRSLIKARRCRYCTGKCVSISFCLISVPVLFAVLSLISFFLFRIGLHHIPLQSTASIGGNSTVIAGQDCYTPMWTRHVNITKATENVNIYRVKQEDIRYQIDELKLRQFGFYPLPTDSTYRSSLNYYLADRPLYSAGNSTITYTFSARIDANFTGCPLEVHQFTTYSKYRAYAATFTPVNGPADSPQCTLLANQTIQKVTLNYHLQPNTFYYFSMETVKGLYLNVTITGKISRFNVSGLTPMACSLRTSSDPCGIVVTNSSIPYSLKPVCLLVQTSNFQQSNITLTVTPVTWNVGSVASLPSFTLIVFISVTMAIVVLAYTLYQHRKEAQELSRYEEHIAE